MCVCVCVCVSVFLFYAFIVACSILFCYMRFLLRGLSIDLDSPVEGSYPQRQCEQSNKAAKVSLCNEHNKSYSIYFGPVTNAIRFSGLVLIDLWLPHVGH